MTIVNVNLDEQTNEIVSITSIKWRLGDKRKTIVAIIKDWHKMKMAGR